MELLQLKYFMKVAELNNVSQAAKSLNVVQSAVSRSIMRLEEDLGVTLFDRKGKRIQLNDSGRLAYTHAKMVLDSVEEFYNSIVTEDDITTIRIGVEAGSFVVPALMAGYNKIQQGIEFDIVQHKEQQDCDILITSCDEGNLDRGKILISEEVKLLIPKNLMTIE